MSCVPPRPLQELDELNHDIQTRFRHSTCVRRSDAEEESDHLLLCPPENGLEGEKHLTVWSVSHCNTSAKREDFVRELRRHMPVNVIGECGRRSCSPRGSSCHEEFERGYFFHLSFENSIFKDYVTERMYFTLLYDIVPVTFGAADMKALAPPGSYIDALKFRTPKDLAGYLKKVAKSFELYRSYFAWRGKYSVVPWSVYSYNKLCFKLYSASFRKKIRVQGSLEMVEKGLSMPCLESEHHATFIVLIYNASCK